MNILSDNNYVGNISTIVKAVSMMVAGWFIGYVAAQGFDFGVDAVTLSQVISAFIFLILAYIDAKFPNTFAFLGNANLVDMGTILGYPSEEVVLNDEYTSVPDDSEAEDVSDDGC